MNLVRWILRIGVALTFMGHGLLAMQEKQSWIKYLETVGFSSNWAVKIMPFIGGLDLLVALIILIKPYRYLILWAFIWAFATALIRPLSGESVLVFVERGANWAAPLALYFLEKVRADRSENQ